MRSSFRGNAQLLDDSAIQVAKQAAITAMGNLHALQAMELATQYRDKQIVSRKLSKSK